MKSRALHVLLALSAVFAFIGGCGSSAVAPTAGGGTHTGNPEVVACVNTIMDAMAPGDEWMVSAYLDSTRLDPSIIDPANPGANLAKARAVPDSGSPVDTVLRYDTIVVPRSRVLAGDTVVMVRLVVDTIDTVIDGSARTYLVTNLVVDTTTAIDTLVWSDTLVRVDTLVVYQSIATDTNGKASGAPATWSAEQLASPPSIVKSSDASVNRTAALTTISRAVVALQMTTRNSDASISTLEYRDGDSDFFLFSAAPSRIPEALFSESRESGSSIIRTTARIDAGPDRTFMTVEDNRIRALTRQETVSGLAANTVAFVPATTAGMSMLTVDIEGPAGDTIRRSSISYHTMDATLDSMFLTTDYRYGTAGSLEASIRDISMDAAGGTIRVARFSARIFYTDGTSASLNGSYSVADGLAGEFLFGERKLKVTAVRGESPVLSER